MLFSPKENGQGLLEFVIGLALFILFVYLVSKYIVIPFWQGIDNANCGEIEQALGECIK